MCWWTEGTLPSPGTVVEFFVILAPDTKRPTYLLDLEETGTSLHLFRTTIWHASAFHIWQFSALRFKWEKLSSTLFGFTDSAISRFLKQNDISPMSEQVSVLCQLHPVAWSLPELAAKMLVQAFLSCHLDYCNVLLYGIKDTLFWRLQLIQNAAVRLLTGARQHDHISPVLRRSHWLRVKQQVIYKLATVVYKSLDVKPCHTWWTTASFPPRTPTTSLSHEHIL